MKPEMPVLLIWRGHVLDCTFEPDKPMITTLLGAVNYARRPDSICLFDSAGQKWKCSGVSLNGKPITWLHRFGTYLFLNPVRSCSFTWNLSTPYQLTEITGLIQREVEEDDDILTQFHEKDEWYEALANARTYGDVIGVYRRLIIS